MWSWNETVFGITFVTSAPSDRVFRFVPALLSFPGMTSFLTSGSFQQGIRALGAARGVFLQKIRDSLHLGIVRLGLEVLWSPGWNKCLSSSSLWIQDRGVSLSIGSLGKSLPRCKRIYRSNESLNCAEVILRASHSSHCNSWKKKILCTFHRLETGTVMATTGCIFLWEVGQQGKTKSCTMRQPC